MALDDDLFIVSMLTKGWPAIVGIVLFIAVVAWQCRQEDKCESKNMIYLKQENICVDKSAIEKP